MTEPTIQLPGYEIGGKIGDTALTEVWSAWQPALQRRVSLKVLKPQAGEDPEEVARFTAEARDAANLRHPVIVAIYNVTHHEGQHVVVMEHAEGPSLYEVLAQGGRLPWARAAMVALRVAEALQYAWDHARLIHRRVSPTSIRLEPGGGVKFAYMGLSMRVDPLNPSRRLEPGCIEGLPYYMSPEQARGAVDLDYRTDMYGLGATLYHMVTGHMPFGDRDPMEAVRCQIAGTLPCPVRFCPDLSPSLLYVMAKLMRRDPGDRYADWAEAIDELHRAGTGHVIVRTQVRHVASVIETEPAAGGTPGARGRPRVVLRKKAG